MALIAEILVSLLLVMGGIFGFLGSYGLVKLGHPMARLHVPTKATTLGVGSVLIASMLYFAVFEGSFSFREILIALFLFLTAPITAHFIAKAWLHRHGQRAELPPAGGDTGWAGFEGDDPAR